MWHFDALTTYVPREEGQKHFLSHEGERENDAVSIIVDIVASIQYYLQNPYLFWLSSS